MHLVTSSNHIKYANIKMLLVKLCIQFLYLCTLSNQRCARQWSLGPGTKKKRVWMHRNAACAGIKVTATELCTFKGAFKKILLRQWVLTLVRKKFLEKQSKTQSSWGVGHVMTSCWFLASIQNQTYSQVSFRVHTSPKPVENAPILVITWDFREEMVSSSSCLRDNGINPLNFVSYSCRM